MVEKIRTVSILGPTASGKTAVSLDLASRLDGEIVSCDSMQIYEGMDIGTATPEKSELEKVMHHMINVVRPDSRYSAMDYASAASDCIERIHESGKMPLICGGTGLYYDALMKISDKSYSDGDEEYRKSLYEYAKEHGNEKLHDMLSETDPEAAAGIHYNNVKRVVRALELYRITGRTKTEIDREQLLPEKRYDDSLFILRFENRDLLYSRINDRVDSMMKAGLAEEATAVLRSDTMGLTASQAIGYKEFIPYLRGECTLEETVEMIKLNTRHYAKRQIMWFNRYRDEARYITVDSGGTCRSPASVADEIFSAVV